MRLAAVFLLLPFCSSAQLVNRLDPQVKAIADAVSEARIAANLKRLEAFETRNLLSSDADPEHGIGAARRWLFEQFQSFSPRLQVQYDSYKLKKHGRVVRDVELNNVVAVLPGAKHPERQILITAHYDSLAIVMKPPDPKPDNPLPEESEVTEQPDWEKSAASPIAPGVTDDGSGVALVLELARILSGYQFDCTLVFITFSGEEEGLLGSTLYAGKAKEAGRNIEAVLNSDIIGSDAAGDGRRENRAINVYAAAPDDSPSRTLGRYVKEIGERYVPEMRVNVVFRAERFARGGDQTPFDRAGYAGVRFTTPTENFQNQHSVTDTFANTSVPYTALVTRVNAAVAASLALAPAAPVVTRTLRTGERKGMLVPRLGRGKSEYDAVLRWAPAEKDAELLGYAVVTRSTIAPFWEKEVFVGNVGEYRFPNVSIDDAVFGVKAIGKDGNSSLVAPYVMVLLPEQKVETY